jgi:hypothetical protein
MRLFITYGRDDVDRVSELAQLLTVGGHTVWFDNQLLPGQDWKKELGEEIRRCDALVYALTRDSAASEWCAWELATAARLKKAIVPVLLEDGVPIPAQLETLQYADFRQGPTAIATAKLIGALGLMQKVPADRPLPVPANPQGVPSRAWENAEHWTDYVVSSQHQPQDEAEEIQGKFVASMNRGLLLSQGGRLIVTNQRVLFEPYRMNLKPKPLAIALRDITAVFPSNWFGITPSGLTVRCGSGEEYQFNVFGRDEIIALIERLRAAK